MNIENTWNEIAKRLRKEEIISLSKGGKFKAYFDQNIHAIIVTPEKSGINRPISKNEWGKFGEKFNTVLQNGYDPFRPGHYTSITRNASYIVAILKFFGHKE